MHPRTFFFAGKAAPAYRLAKLIIKFINNLAATIDGDPAVRGRIKVVFLPEYCVSLAEHLIPASDVSNQISTAGYEASGTSNMKFMMNGALTIGTRDGATIEMAAEAGEENFFLFGLTAEQVAGSRAWYNPQWHYEHESETREALDLIFSGYFSRNEPGVFAPLRDALLTQGDHYMHLADLKSYLEADERLRALYNQPDEWARKAILNVAGSGKFSSDRTIAEYAGGNLERTAMSSAAEGVMEKPLPASTTGRSFPVGATLVSGGANFSVFSRSAAGIDLLLFDRVDDSRPSRVIPIDPLTNLTYHYWHVFVPGVEAGQIYGFRAYGPFDPARGFRFDPSKLLLDPYGRAVAVPKNYSRDAACQEGDNTATAMKSVVTDPHAYDWEGDVPLNRPWSRTIIYEMHVRGFTAHPSSGLPESKRGTYAGLIEKIPYLQQLGITAVELLPVFQFDPQAAPAGLTNYWGYSPVSFFAPHQAYSSRQDPLGPIDEFRDMVKALHRAGIEVILDIVFNHTAEGGDDGPTLCFRGLDNPTYYILCEDRSQYANFSGTGNTLNANNPIVRRVIVDSLRYWVNEMHVDGFRFDLASILARDSSGAVMPNPPVLWDIESDPALAGTKMIAEAWDAAGLYQVGNFVGDSWKEWNDRFRDDVRDFFRGANDSVGRFSRSSAWQPKHLWL